jgi:PAS domain S-box-containing protein
MVPPPANDSGREAASTTASTETRLVDGIATHAIFELDAEGCIDTWTQSAAALYGVEAAEITGSHFETLFADDRDPDPDIESVLAAARTDPQEIEHWNEGADGTVFWATLTVSPLREAGEFTGYAVISQDTTGKKQYEQMLERQNDRLKEFTDIIAHDLRNPLNVIDGRIDLYRKTHEDDHIDHIEKTTDRMERLVEDLLRIARQGAVVTDPARTDLESVIETAWEGTGDQSSGASLSYRTVPPIAGDFDRLCVLFENLFRNAIEHAGPAVAVEVGPLDQGFYVEDDGPGFPTGQHEAVFDHGFTTAEDGSGYGLSVIRTIVNAHGWAVAATEAEGGGARIEVTGVEFLE